MFPDLVKLEDRLSKQISDDKNIKDDWAATEQHGWNEGIKVAILETKAELKDQLEAFKAKIKGLRNNWPAYHVAVKEILELLGD